MMRAKWLLLVLLVSFAGCMTYTPPAPSPAASAESDAQAKQFTPPQGMGTIYVSRPSELTIFGQPVPYSVAVDGRQAGGLQPGMYYCMSVAPGKHTLSAASEAGTSSLAVPVEAGKNYFYQITISKGAGGVKKLDLSWVIIEPMGKLMVNNNKRAQASIE